jgi:glycosyltransferase involved in cell wall biosynthesis
VNILCVDQFSNLGGGQRSLLDLLPAFSANGWNPAVAVPGDGPFPALVREAGFRTHHLPREEYTSGSKSIWEMVEYSRHLPRATRSLRRLARSHGTSLIYVNGPRLMPPAALVSRLSGIPIVFHCHNRLFQQSAIRLIGRSLQFARAAVIACCDYAAAPLRVFISPDRISIIHNGVKKVTKKNPRTRGSSWRMGVVGRVESEKGQLDFIKAARCVLERFPGCRFVIVGAPLFSDCAYYKQVIAASEGLPVTFVGWQNDISQAFENIDLLVVPSGAAEATTRVILEAYSAGTPVVAFPCGGIPEVVRNGETGFLARERTPEALADCINSVLAMKEPAIEAVTNRAETYWSEAFQLDDYRQNVCEVLSRVMRQSHAVHRLSMPP